MSEPTIEALDLVPDEVNITFIGRFFKVRRATASDWVARYDLKYRVVGKCKMIPKHELVRLARIRNEK